MGSGETAGAVETARPQWDWLAPQSLEDPAFQASLSVALAAVGSRHHKPAQLFSHLLSKAAHAGQRHEAGLAHSGPGMTAACTVQRTSSNAGLIVTICSPGSLPATPQRCVSTPDVSQHAACVRALATTP